ncbi:DUF3099 domain-containing protein [Litorihabitans aurantiacus]|uniref:DUF3099 domain-containing protein n=1 Tax=Litorihabitans aurantiacus TaxID=1930061 RepID=A0AA37UQ75_9MICO|nr:DUF3099 domain-containing protein [Litorihabitans aurantiacus]GMA31046.1 hypothetical protein GCM10025875_10380 [Litorihabitans aurantiacus]
MDQVPSITSAQRSRGQDVSGRAMQYAIMMGIRVACFFAAIFTEGWLRWTFAAGAVVLPYIAVVIGNAGRRRRASDNAANLLDTGALPHEPTPRWEPPRPGGTA